MDDAMTPDEIRDAEGLIEYRFEDRELLEQSLTHASVVDSRLESNERLEFLGDAILGMVVCDYLFREFDDFLEGEMTKIKSSVVSRQVCADIAADIGLDRIVRLGKGMSNRESLPRSVLAAVYESLVGAIFIDGGIHEARRFILRHLGPRISDAAKSGHQCNFKSVLQQAAQQEFDQTPQYVVLDEQGPDHAKCFEICVELGARRFGSCWGPSKKHAEQQAALCALLELGYATEDRDGEVVVDVPNGK